jgi:molybdopterin biosynthesis enzyme
MEKFLTLKSVDQILQLIQQFAPLDKEGISLEDSFGRILAEHFPAPQDLPGFARSSMDGYAVRAMDTFGASESMPALFDCMGECHMGEVPALVIGPGQTARIWTGGMLPPGADAVVMLEYAREAGKNQIELTRPVAPLSGRAAVGLGVKSAAVALNLNFIPVGFEEYDLIIPDRYMQDKKILTLLEVIRSAEFKQAVSALGGYNVEKTGEIVWKFAG